MLYYLHIPKSAGTSVRHLFSSLYGGRLIEVYRGIDESYCSDLKSRSNDESVFYGHFCFSLHELLDDRQPRYMTLIRHPVERVLSWYKHQLRDANLPLNKRIADDRLTLGEIVELGLATEVNNHSVRMICASYKSHRLYKFRDSFSSRFLNKQYFQFNAQRHLKSALHHIDRFFSFVGTTEHTELLRNFLISQNGARSEELPPVPRDNVSPEIDITLDSQTLALILEANQLDLALFERFSSNCFVAPRN